jgi:hypothetical protein|tara:strand:- start:31 stop:1023 length:993 start_codon:yes stop_codon:yes gene_type:complete
MTYHPRLLIYPLSIICMLMIGFFGQSFLSRNRAAPDEKRQEAKREETNVAISQLHEENERLRKRIETLKDAPTVEDTKPQVEVSVIGDRPAQIPDMENLRQRILEKQQSQSEKKINLKVAALEKHLGLSDKQREEVRKLMLARAAAKREKFSRIFNISGEKTNGNEALEIVNDVLSAGAEENTFDADLASLLNDDQKEAYAGYQAGQRANMAEARANQDLAALQSMFDLSSEQKDQAFDAFAELAGKDLEGVNQVNGILNAGRIIQQRENRISALEPILTAEQMAVYRESPAANASTFMNFGDDLDGATVIGTSITIDAPLKIHPDRKKN